MVWSRRNSLESHRDGEDLSEQAKKHAKLRLWLWRKRKGNGIFRMSKCNRQILRNYFCLQPKPHFKTKGANRNCKAFGSPDVITSSISTELNERKDETKLEICKITSGPPSVSSAVDLSTVHNNWNGAVHDMPLILANVYSEASDDCVCIEPEHNVTTEVVLNTENHTGDENSECQRQKISKNIQEYIQGFHRRYGSFFPLEKNDIFKHLKEEYNKDCEIMILEIIIEHMANMVSPVTCFEVKYKKHRLTMDDLSTLANENWLNDQVINMYGELIMDSTHSKVHFLNSFFHRQLVTKGYEGVKRWTKQVDLFSKDLLLVPVHVEVHWCLVSADFNKKTVCLYDSQGVGLKIVARNIVKYLLQEAKEKKKTAFEMGWTVSLKEEIPQQTNENDCGVFVLEYSRCLALSEPLAFTQKDVPKLRKRIYKELCDCALQKNG